MLVEDNPLVREALACVVEQEHDLRLVATAPDCATALDRALLTRPRLVVMDVNLPDGSGLDATRLLCRVLPEVRVVVLSASCDGHLVRTALAAGACGYLV
jgi:DNA-binding NarL/FixJ family response regulator